jgi:hypothetical protein
MAEERPFREHLVDLEDRLVARISGLETQNRALRRLTTILAGVVGVTFVFGVVHFLSPSALEFVRPNVGVIEANGFVLRDRDGAIRAQLLVEEDGRVRFGLHDLTETRRVSVSVLSGGSPGMALTDRDGQNRLAMGVANDGSSTLVFADRAGTPRTVLGLSAQESAGLSIVDARGVRRVELGVDSDGMATVLMPGAPVETDTEAGNDSDP